MIGCSARHASSIATGCENGDLFLHTRHLSIVFNIPRRCFIVWMQSVASLPLARHAPTVRELMPDDVIVAVSRFLVVPRHYWALARVDKATYALLSSHSILAPMDARYFQTWRAVQEKTRELKRVNEQTPELCLATVTKYPWALKLVNVQTPEICLAAVTQNGRALEYVKVQTHELCLAAVTRDGTALQFVKEQTREICLAAVTQEGYALRFVKEQTHEICLAAVTDSGWALDYVAEQTH